MKSIAFFIFSLAAAALHGQAPATDREVLLKHVEQRAGIPAADKRSRASTRGIRLYQNHIGPQLATHCVFAQSCSRFGDQALVEFGLLKGYFLAIDRLLRCNKVSPLETFPVRINSFGKIIETPADFRRRHPAQ